MEGMTTPLQGWQNDSLSPLLQDSELLHCPMDEAKNIFFKLQSRTVRERGGGPGLPTPQTLQTIRLCHEQTSPAALGFGLFHVRVGKQ